MAVFLLTEWYLRSEPGAVDPAGQNIQKVRNNTTALIEVIKYGSKIFTEVDVNKKSKDRKRKKGQHKLYVAALNNIYHAMRGLRIFERFGFNLPPGTKPAPVGSRVVKDYHEWRYHFPSADWISVDTGNPLCNYIPPPELLDLLENSFDIKKG